MPALARQLAGIVEFKVELALSASEQEDAGLWQPDGAGALWDISGVWDGSEVTWDDVTSYTLGANATRGRDRFESRFKTGVMTLILDNDSALFNPDVSGIFQLDLRPGRWARISGRAPAISDVWIPLWTGQIDGFEDLYSAGAASVNSGMRCLDFFARWQIDDPPALSVPIPAGQRTDQRVNRILDDAGWPEGSEWRDIQIGLHTMSSSTLPSSRLQEIMAASDAEGGGFFCDGGGVATFKARDWLETDPRSANVQLSAGAIGDEIAIISADTDWSTSRVYGDVRLARVGGTEVRVQDGLSTSAYGVRTFRRFDYQLETDGQVSTLADRILEAFRYDRLRIESVQLHPDTPAAAFALLDTRLGDRIRVQVRTGQGWSYALECWVNGITHNVTADDWNVTLRVDNADLSPPFSGGSFDELAYDESYFIGGG